MASGLSETLQALEERMTLLAQKCEELNAELARKEVEITSLRHDNAQLISKLNKEESEGKFLRMSYRLATNPDDIIAARRLISSLIRNIDKCIEDLKE